MNNNDEHPSDEKLGAYWGGNLTDAERREIVAHIRGCISCASARDMIYLRRRADAAGVDPLSTIS